MHDRGYQYIGPTSLYRLTIPEMARLYEGWRSTREKEQAAQQAAHGNTTGTTRQRNYGPHNPRASDWSAYDEFRERHGIESSGGAGAGTA